MVRKAARETVSTSLPGSRIPGLGFSLIEVVVVIVLAGLAAALVVPSFSRGLTGIQLEATGRDLITRMKQARSQAIAQQRVFRILIPDRQDEPGGASSYVLANEYEEILQAFPLPNDVTLTTDSEIELKQVSFYPNGRSSGGRLIVEHKQGRYLPIVVDPVTGFARIERWEAEP